MSSHVAAPRSRDFEPFVEELQLACSGPKRQGSAFRPKSKSTPSPHGVSSNKNVNPMPTGLSFRSQDNTISWKELVPTKRESTQTGLSFRSREDSQSRAGPIHGRDPTMSNARDRNDAVHPPCSAAAPWKKSSFRQRAVRLDKSLSSPTPMPASPFRLAHPPRQPDRPRPPKGASRGKNNRRPTLRNLCKSPKYRLTSRPISYIMLTWKCASRTHLAQPAHMNLSGLPVPS